MQNNILEAQPELESRSEVCCKSKLKLNYFIKAIQLKIKTKQKKKQLKLKLILRRSQTIQLEQ